ncbi:hypothetical protein BKA62DRAFT_192897 [Auriculariales sp. MPI-PUGE-AT-0066]|nr:hypothetical protein BKA62DRAFT_192897 [Auriculariales sp. MPI-PUGE-AT-0066]
MLARRCRLIRPARLRQLHTSAMVRERETFDPNTVERASDEVDVCIVGAGPAGLSAAIRLKQLEQESGREIRVVVLEKAGEIGAHIVSGAAIEPRALNELLPDWQSRSGHPLVQPATSSHMYFLTEKLAIPIPHPPQMGNKGNYLVSLSQFVAWLGTVAEEQGVEIYPGFAGASLLYNDSGDAVQGVMTNDVGLDRKFRMKDSFEPGMEFRAKVTLLAEGAHGSLTKTAVKQFDLRKNSDPQTYGFGIKEVWRVPEDKWKPGRVDHTLGWPLDAHTYGGSFMYHMADRHVHLGLVVGLDYANPHMSPYREFQRMKHHPYFANVLTGGERVAYAARVLNEGGLQSLPKLHFPGGALLGCSAGFLNVAKIKGTHTAMKSGMVAAEAAFAALQSENAAPADMSQYEEDMKKSWVWKELKEVRNMRPSFNTRLGIWGGMAYSGIDSLFVKGHVPWTFRHKGSDASHTKRASECKPIEYPPFQPPLSTDLLTSLALTGTNHAEDQPVHLRLPAGAEAHRKHVEQNVSEYAGLLQRGCPAGVYEYVEEEGTPSEESWNGKKLVINSQNCIHCKFCDVKVPTQDITWTVPEGGGGPKYTIT